MDVFHFGVRQDEFDYPRGEDDSGDADISVKTRWTGTTGIRLDTTAARLLNQFGTIEDFPTVVLGEARDLALLFKQLATLKTDARLFQDVEELRWRGPTDAFPAWTERMSDQNLAERSARALR